MGKYKIGDIAASLPKPKTPATESGKKLQNLFSEFYAKKKTNDIQDNLQIDSKSPKKSLVNSNLSIMKSKSNKQMKRKLSTGNNTVDESENAVKAKGPNKSFKNHMPLSEVESPHSPKRKKFKGYQESTTVESAHSPKKNKFKRHQESTTVESPHSPKKNKFKRYQESTTVDSHTFFTDESTNKGTVFIKHKKKHRKALAKAGINNASNSSNLVMNSSVHEPTKFKDNEGNMKKQKKFSSEPESFPRKKKFKKFQERQSNSNFKSFNNNDIANSSNSDISSSIGKHTNFKDTKRQSNFEHESFPRSKNHNNNSQEFQSNSQSFNKKNQSNEKFNKKSNMSSKNSMFGSDSLFKPFKDDLDSGSNDNAEEAFSKKLKKKNKKKNKEEDVASSHTAFNDKKQLENNSTTSKEQIDVEKTIDNDKSDPKIKPERKWYNNDFIPLEVKKHVDPAEKTERTVFVGNLPKTVEKKGLLKMFNSFGSIENIRLRGAIPQKETIPKKVAGITGKYHEAIHSIKAYIVFEKVKDARKALVLNGSLLKGRHIVVDAAANCENLYDDKQTIFIGNLPYDVDDEAIWSAFENCGKIDRVRIIRDCGTGVGKGFGYVSFGSIQAKENALSLEGVQIGGRTIRIKAVQSKEQEKRENNKTGQFHSFKQHALKIKKEKSENFNCRKSTKKIMKTQKKLAKKKKIAKIFGNV